MYHTIPNHITRQVYSELDPASDDDLKDIDSVLYGNIDKKTGKVPSPNADDDEEEPVYGNIDEDGNIKQSAVPIPVVKPRTAPPKYEMDR